MVGATFGVTDRWASGGLPARNLSRSHEKRRFEDFGYANVESCGKLLLLNVTAGLGAVSPRMKAATPCSPPISLFGYLTDSSPRHETYERLIASAMQ